VLIVDDAAENRAVLVSMLWSLGFDVLEAENGQECLDKAIQTYPDIIFLDLRMPVLDGFGATQHIRSTPDIQDVKIIAVSASVFEATRKRALDIGFDDFLIKPVQLETLLSLLQTHLNLEWTYEDAPEEPLTPAPEEPLQVPPLPPSDRAHICHLAQLGMSKPLIAVLDTLEDHDPAWLPCLEKLRHYVKNYQFDQIVELLQAQNDET
jgi:CheY-like chemotaxis protein